MDEVLLRRTHSIAMIVMSATLRKDLIRHALRARHLPLRGEGKGNVAAAKGLPLSRLRRQHPRACRPVLT